jgi:serine/threonine protein kinase
MGSVTEGRMTTTKLQGGTQKWMSPERLTDDSHRRSTADDAYAFGCLCYYVSHDQCMEIYFHLVGKMFSGRLVFHNLQGMAAALRVLNAQRPPRPTAAECRLPMSDHMWSLVESCWSQTAGDRPPMQVVLSKLHAAEHSTVTFLSGTSDEDVATTTQTPPEQMPAFQSKATLGASVS